MASREVPPDHERRAWTALSRIYSGFRLALTKRSAAVSFLLATLVCFAAVAGGAAAGLGAATAGALLIGMTYREGSGRLPLWSLLALGAFVFSSILPVAVSLPLQLAVLAGSFLLWFTRPRADRRGNHVVPWAVAITVYWTLLVLHPNVPDLLTGLEGFRKTVFALSGLAFGCAVQAGYRYAVERALIGLLSAALVISIFAHFWFPGLSQNIHRDADVYTAVFGGNARLEGVFAGPFHVALAGVVLLVWAMVRWRESPAWAVIVGLVGATSTYLSLVRTAYVAVLFVVVAMVLARRGNRLRRIAKSAALGVAVAGGLLLLSGTAPSDLIGQLSTDGRFLNRFPGYREGLELLWSSPVYGWGAGSAGDTFGDDFAGGQHVTSHNLALKVAVEGGFLGLILFAGLFVAVCRHLARDDRRGLLAIGVGVALLAMGLTGSAIETLPVSWIVFAFLGLAIGRTDRPLARNEVIEPGISQPTFVQSPEDRSRTSSS